MESYPIVEGLWESRPLHAQLLNFRNGFFSFVAVLTVTNRYVVAIFCKC